MNYDAIKRLLTLEIKTLDELISKNLLHCQSATIQDISRYIVFSGGKRIRPYMLLILSKLFDYQKDDNHIKLAAVLELIHTATLLHDDVIDNSNLRRNKPSAHLKWGVRNSITAGNWLFALAFKLVASCENNELTKVISHITNAMAKGELAQLSYKTVALKNVTKQTIKEADYYRVIEAKTGVLFAAATELAAILSHQSHDTIIHTRAYGMHLGLAFQIKDDLLDYLSDAASLGKNAGDDLAEGKMTLPLIYLQERSPAEFVSAMQAIKNCDQGSIEFGIKFQHIKNLLNKYNCIEDAYNKARKERDCALDMLKQLPQNEYTKYLYNITLDSVARDS